MGWKTVAHVRQDRVSSCEKLFLTGAVTGKLSDTKRVCWNNVLFNSLKKMTSQSVEIKLMLVGS